MIALNHLRTYCVPTRKVVAQGFKPNVKIREMRNSAQMKDSKILRLL